MEETRFLERVRKAFHEEVFVDQYVECVGFDSFGNPLLARPLPKYGSPRNPQLPPGLSVLAECLYGVECTERGIIFRSVLGNTQVPINVANLAGYCLLDNSAEIFINFARYFAWDVTTVDPGVIARDMEPATKTLTLDGKVYFQLSAFENAQSIFDAWAYMTTLRQSRATYGGASVRKENKYMVNSEVYRCMTGN